MRSGRLLDSSNDLKIEGHKRPTLLFKVAKQSLNFAVLHHNRDCPSIGTLPASLDRVNGA